MEEGNAAFTLSFTLNASDIIGRYKCCKLRTASYVCHEDRKFVGM